MISIPSLQPQIQEQQLRKRIAALEAEVRRLRPFEQQVIFENTLFANPHISPTHRLTLRECLFGKQKIRVNELTKVYIPSIAEKIGLSAKTTGKSLQFLAETGAIRRETETKTNENGERITRVFLGLTEQIYHPETIKPPTKRNHGGKRHCKDCGSDNLIKQTTITCMDCGAEQHRSRRLINQQTKTTDTQLDPRYTDDQHIDHIDHDIDQSGINIARSNNIDTINVHVALDTAPDLKSDDVDHGDNHGTSGPHDDDNQDIAPTTIHDRNDAHNADNGKDTSDTITINGIPNTTITITPPMDNLTPLKTKKEPTDNLTPGLEKPPTPPVEAVASPVTSPAILPLPTGRQAMQAMKERPQSAMPTGRQAEQETERELDQETAQLLLDMAGDTQEHIVMNTNPNNPKKYLTVHRPLTVEDMRLHLTGKRTLGATLRHKDATTRAICCDTDDTRKDKVTWQDFKESAKLLIARGYQPLLEPSPAGRGGHLWIIFTERVNAQAAYTQVCGIAPRLKECGEYWPGKSNQKVRLPAGKYVTPTISQWTHLYDVQGDELTPSALLTHQTPADLIPANDTAEPQPDVSQDHRRNRDVSSVTQAEHGGGDEYHRRKYGQHVMWVEWPTEAYLIDRFNEQHTIDDLATRERGGMINAATIGRPERTASVGVTKDGQRFTDFGAGARKADGTQDGGDAFEFYIRLHNLNKSDVLRELGVARNREASTELLRSARAGELPPAWVMDIITDKGRTVYNQNAVRHGHNTLEAHSRGVVGFSEAGSQEKQEPCLAWQAEQEDREQGIPEDFTMDTPCEQCGCCLYRDMLGSMVCVRCYPPRGYHNYSDLIDARYPCRKWVEFS